MTKVSLYHFPFFAFLLLLSGGRWSGGGEESVHNVFLLIGHEFARRNSPTMHCSERNSSRYERYSKISCYFIHTELDFFNEVEMHILLSSWFFQEMHLTPNSKLFNWGESFCLPTTRKALAKGAPSSSPGPTPTCHLASCRNFGISSDSLCGFSPPLLPRTSCECPLPPFTVHIRCHGKKRQSTSVRRKKKRNSTRHLFSKENFFLKLQI